MTTRKTAFKLMSYMLLLAMLAGVLPIASQPAVAAETEIELSISIDGSYLEGMMYPEGIDELPAAEGYYHCDGSCSDPRYASNKWYTENDDIATDFEHGKEYYFQICVHLNDGYKMPDGFDVNKMIRVYGIEWSHVTGGMNAAYGVYYAEFHLTYDENVGIPYEAPTEIILPIEIDGSSLAGITAPAGLSDLPKSDQYYYCDSTCGARHFFVSNRWYLASNNDVAESFEDGEEYYFQICIHPGGGYKFPTTMPDLSINVTGIKWDSTYSYKSEVDNLYYVEFHITYNAEIGIPSNVVALPIEIDGSSLVGITSPAGISELPASHDYYHCDASCGSDAFVSNVWYDVVDMEIAESFVDGRRYFFQIAVHPQPGYTFPANFDVDTIYQGIHVSGVEWEDIRAGKSDLCNAYWMEFYITYKSEEGVPAEILTEITLPIEIDGSSLAGITSPVGISDLPESEEYSYCDFSIGGGIYASNTWYQDNVPVTAFADGEEYFYQIAIQPKDGYCFPQNFDPDQGVVVSGVAWDSVVAGYNDYYDIYWIEFHLVYRADVEDSSEDSESGSSEEVVDIGILGDVNGDGSVDSLDAAQVLKYDALLIELDGAALQRADVNSDGMVDSLDAAMILKFDAGLIFEF